MTFADAIPGYTYLLHREPLSSTPRTCITLCIVSTAVTSVPRVSAVEAQFVLREVGEGVHVVQGASDRMIV